MWVTTLQFSASSTLAAAGAGPPGSDRGAPMAERHRKDRSGNGAITTTGWRPPCRACGRCCWSRAAFCFAAVLRDLGALLGDALHPLRDDVLDPIPHAFLDPVLEAVGDGTVPTANPKQLTDIRESVDSPIDEGVHCDDGRPWSMVRRRPHVACVSVRGSFWSRVSDNGGRPAGGDEGAGVRTTSAKGMQAARSSARDVSV
jgi:hypothetical protein